MRSKAILVLGLLLFAVSASTFANDLHQDGIIYDLKDFAVFASHWLDVNCSQSDWCNGCDLNMSGSVDPNDLREFIHNWLFITAEDLAVMDARDAADAGFEHARLYMIESLSAATDKDDWLAYWYDPAAAEVGYSFGPVPLGEAEFQYDIYKGNELTGYEIVSTGTAGSVTHTVHASMLARIAYTLGSGIRAKGSIDVGLGGGLYTIPADEKLTIQTYSITGPPSGGIILKNGLTVPGDVIIGTGGDIDEVVVARHNVVIEGEIKAGWDEMQFPPVAAPILPPGVLTQDPNDPDVWIINADGEFGPLDIGLTASDPVIIKIDGNNGVYYPGGELIPLNIFINGDMILGNGAELIITTGSAVNLYLGGSLEAKQGSKITYEKVAGIESPPEADIIEAAKSLTLFGTETCDSLILKNDGDFYGAIYATEAYTELRNSGDFYGVIIHSSKAKISNSGVFYYVAPLFDSQEVEVLYVGVKHGSWWEDFASQPDVIKETFESVIRKSRTGSATLDTSVPSLLVLYYSTPNATGEPDLDPDMYAEFYLNGTDLMLDTGTYDSNTGETTQTGMETVANNVTELQFAIPAGSADVEMTVTFIDRAC